MTRAGCPALHLGSILAALPSAPSLLPGVAGPGHAGSGTPRMGCWFLGKVRGRSVVMAAASVTTRRPYPTEKSFCIFPTFRLSRTFWSCRSGGWWSVSTLSWV